MSPSHPLALVIIPTYNEIDSLESQVEEVLRMSGHVDVLIVDDNSPDGTGHLADRLSRHPHIFTIHRPGKLGLGSAYVAGFLWALDRDYGVIVEMDADGSHPASSLPEMISLLASDTNVGVVIGSRWIKGGEVVDWPKSREVLSRAANYYARRLLRLSTMDVTGGYRAYAALALRSVPLDEVRSRGYCFQIDMTLRTADAGFRVVEYPIRFRERQAGKSKMTLAIVLEAMGMVTYWGLSRLMTTSRGERLAVKPQPRRVSQVAPDRIADDRKGK